MNYLAVIMFFVILIFCAIVFGIYFMIEYIVGGNPLDKEKPLFVKKQLELRPWTKKEKRKPKANDDEAAWKKENQL